jgi:hypothetical protein
MDTEQRGFPPNNADERTTLLAFLDWHRNTLRIKTAGLDAAQLDTPHPPSDLTLGGMLKHLAYVENWWFRSVMAGHADEPWASVDWDADEDWDWHSAAHDRPGAAPRPLRRRGRQGRRGHRVVSQPGRAVRSSQRPHRRALQPALGAGAHGGGVRAAQRPRRPDP